MLACHPGGQEFEYLEEKKMELVSQVQLSLNLVPWNVLGSKGCQHVFDNITHPVLIGLCVKDPFF